MKLFILIVCLAIVSFSCDSQESKNKGSDHIFIDSAVAKEGAVKEGARLEIFMNVDDIRHRLSSVGIGKLGCWRDDLMGGFMSITSYYQFGDEILSNNLAYYLVSDNERYIRELQLVVNINDKKKDPALKKFADVVEKTYKALNLQVDKAILAAAKAGKEISVEKDTYIERIKLQQSKIESWQFLLISK